MTTHFVSETRDNGERFYTLADDAPEWLRDAVQEAHDGTFPDDWVYAECEAAMCAILGGALTDSGGLHEHADSRVDVYTKELYQWAADMCLTALFAEAEESANELGMEYEDTTKRLQVIQYEAICRIARVILEAWTENQTAEEE